jgi:murein DD-endopeptidase MepM/ murein hydrolase activator NlpD
VRAPGDGIVVRTGRLGGLGNAVVLSHGFGITTRYGHLGQIDVAPGQRVARGDALGAVGRSGRATGYHLHYEVRVDSQPADPLGYMLDR